VEVKADAVGADDLDLPDFSFRTLAPLARWKLNFTSSAVKGSPL